MYLICIVSGTLRPLYVIQREQFPPAASGNSTGNSPENYNEKDSNANYVQEQRRSTRGRSFSPPKRQESGRFITLNGDESNARQTLPTGRLQKSSSSDHIRCNGKIFSPSTSSSNSGKMEMFYYY